jgi:hypothetical protein
MSIECMTRVWKHSKAKGSALLLLLAIADYAHDDGTGAYPGMKTLAAKTRMSERNVRYMVQELVGMGELSVEERASTYGTNKYAVLAGQEKIAPPDVPSPNRREERQLSGEDGQPGAEGEETDCRSGEAIAAAANPSVIPSPNPSVLKPRGGSIAANDQTPWCQALTILKASLNKADYKTWVEPTILVRAENGKVVIGGANEYGVQWLREHVSINVADALEKVLGKKVAVEFVVQPPVREDAD